MTHSYLKSSLIILILISSVLILETDFVYAEEEVDWSIFFVTTTDKCYANHHSALNFYASLTEQYLNQFNLPHNLKMVTCITDDVMPLAIQEATKKTDLTILIPDYLMSIKQRHSADNLGHFGNWNARIIVSQAETLLPENKDTGWVLSHELAHFALDWKGYDNNIMGEAVHTVQGAYDKCKIEDTTLAWCTSLWTTVKTPSGKWFPVMSPSMVIETAEYMKPKTVSQPKQEQYSNTPRLDYASQYYYKIKDIVYDLEELCGGAVFSEFKNKSTQEYIKNRLWKIPDACLNASSLYSKMTKGWNLVHSSDSIEIGIGMLSSVHNEVYDVNISNIKSILNKIKKDARDFEKKELYSKLSPPTGVPSDSNPVVTEKQLIPSLYVADSSGKKSKSLTIKPNQEFAIEGYIYKNNIPQSYVDYKILDNTGKRMDGRTNGDGYYKHILTSKHTVHQDFGNGNDKSSTMIVSICISSNCEDVTLYIRGNDSTSNNVPNQDSISDETQQSQPVQSTTKQEEFCFLFWCW